ncbi:IS605 transposase (tnpA) [Helicobacter cetorum MIT 99-5656]|uniref:IS605 transposase (TnpA) n=1 Tax=Helicobacter cetorum (strain ATCC BAA-540 / CCUG 52418 / MIT 99-5656) TaxID=1163745 RepID=I0EUK2_HELCM|nr:IS605 transposase (tnpA) [Helicobacter cetorum MIT 99-5656]
MILVCKYRKKLLQGDLNNFIKAIVDEIATQSNFIIIAMESDMRAFTPNDTIYS